MKIITNNAAYIQKNDLAYLNQSDLAIPVSIYMKVFGNGIVIIDDSNRYEFVEFNSPEEIEFFKSIDWMIDYNEVKDLSEQETIELGQKIAQQKNQIAQKYNSMSSEDRKRNLSMVSQCELLDFKIYSLRDIIWFKRGHIKMKLPEGFANPTGFEHEKGARKLIKRLLNKKKK